MDTQRFLETVIPAEGFKALFVVNVGNLFYGSFDVMTQAALHYDSLGKTVYHVNASFLDPGPLETIDHPRKPGKRVRSWDVDKRIAKRVVGVKSFRLDLDVGDKAGKYGSTDEAFEEFEEWRLRVKMPPSMMILSGLGWHVYWPLATSLPGPQWSSYANQLDELVKQNGLLADPVVTTDIVRVLRPPGTHNYKRGKEPVVFENDCEVYDVRSLFREIVVAPGFIPVGDTSLAEAILGGKDERHEPSDPEQIAASCQQVRGLRDAHGKVPEPQWYAVLGVLAHCGEPGRAFAHSAASGPEWLDEIDRKFDRALVQAGPTTCVKLDGVTPGICPHCPKWGKISSPILLGRGDPLSKQTPGKNDILPPMPDGFKWGKNGSVIAIAVVKIEDENGDEKFVDKIIYEDALYIKSVTFTEVTEKAMATWTTWERSKAVWRDFTVAGSGVNRDEGRREMQDKGIMILPDNMRHFSRYVVESFNMKKRQQLGLTYEQFGWKSNPLSFLASVKGLNCTDDMARFARLLTPRGTTTAWRTAAEELLRRAGHAHQFIALLAFAAPLYVFAEEHGGVCVHAYSRESGRGKSTALDLVSSTWGQREGTHIASNVSEIALLRIIGTLNNLPVVCDDPNRIDAELLKARVMTFCDGQGPQRATKDGTLRKLELHWSTIMSSASNSSIVQTLTAEGEEAQAARLFEIPITKTDGMDQAVGDRLKRTLYENAGSIGQQYVEIMVREHAWLKTVVPALVDKYTVQFPGNTAMRFVVRLFAAVTVAGWLLRKYDLLTVDIEVVMQWAVALAKTNHEEVKADATNSPSDIINQMILDVSPYTISVAHPPISGQTAQVLFEPHNVDIKARWERSTHELLIDRRFVHAWFEKRNHARRVIYQALHAQNIVKGGGGNSPVKRSLCGGTGRPNAGQIRVWVINTAHPDVAESTDPVDNVVQGKFTKKMSG